MELGNFRSLGEFTFHLSISSVSQGFSLLYTEGIVNADGEGCLTDEASNIKFLFKKKLWQNKNIFETLHPI